MEPCNCLDQLLQHVDPSTIQAYKKFMQDIIQGICYHNLNPFTTEAAKSGQPEMAFSSQSGQKSMVNFASPSRP